MQAWLVQKSHAAEEKVGQALLLLLLKGTAAFLLQVAAHAGSTANCSGPGNVHTEYALPQKAAILGQAAGKGSRQG